jgi:UDP-N-acetylglucosamine--N-acetylmuramyl-(pentapeptide) pyrophosphoryl-undecaprenol N-acetylglucosamine transferase
VEKQPYSDKDDSRLTILVLGGSQGAKTINREVLTALPQIVAMNAKLIWQTGKNNYEDIAAESFVAELSQTDNLTVFPFTDDMNDVYDKSHIAITRAGAITLAELETKKIPSVIIPIPKSAGNHQYLNAKDFQDSGKGILLPQSKLNKESLIAALNELAANWNRYYTAFQSSRHLTAAQDIVSTILGDLNEQS